jgi:ankyrin repeat protein
MNASGAIGVTKNNESSIRTLMRAEDVRVAHLAIAEGDVNGLDESKRSPLFYAVLHGELELVTELINHGANPNIRDVNGETPLHFAAREYRPQEVKVLLAHAAIVDLQDEHGNTPLWRAVFDSRNRGEVISLLLAAGADKTLKNRHGVSPEELAKTIANHNAAQFLKD